MMLKETFGKQVRTQREKLNLSQSMLSEKTGISIGHLSHLENGQAECSITYAQKIAEQLQVPLDYLVRESIPGDGTKESIAQQLTLLIESDIYSTENAKVLFRIAKALCPDNADSDQ